MIKLEIKDMYIWNVYLYKYFQDIDIARRVLFLSKWHVANGISGCDKYYFSFPTGYISLALYYWQFYLWLWSY